LLDDRAGHGWICRVVARSWSARQLPRLRRSRRVLPNPLWSKAPFRVRIGHVRYCSHRYIT
jgi:hypothetical protein